MVFVTKVSMNPYKKWSFLFFSILAVVFSLIASSVYIIDPLQMFRKMKYEPFYDFNERHITPGIIKQYDFNAVLLGTSMMQNSKPSQVDKLYNVKAVKLSFPAATILEQEFVFKHAAEKQPLKLVIFSIDSISFSNDKESLGDEFPHHLYNLNHTNIYKYFFDFYLLKKMRKINFLSIYNGRKYEYNFDKVGYWGDSKVYSKISLFDSYHSPVFKNLEFKPDLIKNVSKNLEYIFEPMIKKNPNTEFLVFFPPYSILYWARYSKSGHLKDQLTFKANIYNSLKKYKNVKLFDFQIEKSITHNFNNYCDIMHYSPKINEYIIENLKNEKYLINEGNIQNLLNALKDQAVSFEKQHLPSIIRKEYEDA
jgi:hypothetical protein